MRKICVVTGSRADYGLLYWTMKHIHKSSTLSLLTIVTGMHLSDKHGRTVQQIENDGFNIDGQVVMDVDGNDETSVARSLGIAVSGFASMFAELHPDLVVLLGDRYEILAAAQVAMMTKIPIAHIHGGEVTEGAVDESIRHAITKMSHLHFVAAEPYRKRVLQLGENPKHVHTVGAPGLDHFATVPEMSRAELSEALGINLTRATLFLVTYHSETLGPSPVDEPLQELLAALSAYPDADILITGANNDAGGNIINEAMRAFAGPAKERVFFSESFGQVNYLNALRLADVVIGNSSSAIIEAPVARTASVNIGNRQKGRLRAPSVIDCVPQKDAICAAIENAVSQEFRDAALKGESPYATTGPVGAKIVSIIQQTELDALRLKPFFDL